MHEKSFPTVSGVVALLLVTLLLISMLSKPAPETGSPNPSEAPVQQVSAESSNGEVTQRIDLPMTVTSEVTVLE